MALGGLCPPPQGVPDIELRTLGVLVRVFFIRGQGVLCLANPFDRRKISSIATPSPALTPAGSRPPAPSLANGKNFTRLRGQRKGLLVRRPKTLSAGGSAHLARRRGPAGGLPAGGQATLLSGSRSTGVILALHWRSTGVVRPNITFTAKGKIKSYRRLSSAKFTLQKKLYFCT